MISRALFGLALLASACASPAPPRECFDWVASGPATTELLAAGFQGGGPSFAALLRATLEAESPAALEHLALDDEGDALRVCSTDPAALLVARSAARRLESDPALRRVAIARAQAAGDME